MPSKMATIMIAYRSIFFGDFMGILADRLGDKAPSADEIKQLCEAACNKFLTYSSPLYIYLFGSAAKGHFSYSSDLDFALIFKTKDEALVAKKKILGLLILANCPVDVLFFDLDTFEQRKNYGGVCFEIFHSGKIIYQETTRDESW